MNLLKLSIEKKRVNYISYLKRWMSTLIVAFVAVLSLVACSAEYKPTLLSEKLPPPWSSKIDSDHYLAGKIWHPDSGRFVEAELVGKIAREADYVMLGEKHDNIDHHRIQAWLIESVFRNSRTSPVAFEMLTTDQQKKLEKYQTDYPGNAAQLGTFLKWDDSGWPSWSMYYPVFQAAMTEGAPLIAASEPQQKIRQMVEKGVKAVLGDDAYAHLGLEYKIPLIILEAKRQDIVESHCNRLPESMINPMVQVQHTKDAIMAHILVENNVKYGENGAILVTGAGHARNDYGVPWHLKRVASDKSVVTIGIIEVAEELVAPRQYAAKTGTEKLPFDFVWFTPRSDDEDPCERFSRQPN
jgi:uncharacterized iron-regulated protein